VGVTVSDPYPVAVLVIRGTEPLVFTTRELIPFYGVSKMLSY